MRSFQQMQGRSSPAPSQVEFGAPLPFDDGIELWPSSSIDPSGSVFDLSIFPDESFGQTSFPGVNPLEFDIIENRSETDEMIVDDPPQRTKDVDHSLPQRFGPQFPLTSNSPPTPPPAPTGFSLLSFSSASPSSPSLMDDALVGPARKRRRLEESLSRLSLPAPRSAADLVALQDQLVSLDSDQFQEYISDVERTRALTRVEQQLMRTLKRRILNRESARRSRQERKDQVGVMEERIDALTRELQETKLESAQLTARNAAMRDEIAFSRRLIASNPVLRQLYDEVRARHEAKRAAASSASTPASGSAPASPTQSS